MRGHITVALLAASREDCYYALSLCLGMAQGPQPEVTDLPMISYDPRLPETRRGYILRSPVRDAATEERKNA